MTRSVLPSVCVLFLILAVLPASGDDQGYDPPTLKNRICPAEFWKIVESNNNVHCYSIVTIPDRRQIPDRQLFMQKVTPECEVGFFSFAGSS
uniref:Secreted protein n=1 Tax=Panagrellus redivivus TaxID=6233 RepID=A0A7E4VDM6_PANRE